MKVERGFQRLTIVVSIVVLGLGLAIDATIVLEPHATVQVTLEDGRKVILDRHGPRAFLSDRKSLEEELPDRGELRPMRVEQDPHYGRVEVLPRLLDVKVLRGPEYWWWADSVGTKDAVVLVALIWIGFFTVRWIVHGFARAVTGAQAFYRAGGPSRRRSVNCIALSLPKMTRLRPSTIAPTNESR
jgi:hypothetical protein